MTYHLMNWQMKKKLIKTETEAQLIVETDTLPKKSTDRYVLVYDNYQRWKQENRNLNW